jgi:hypothetical protein
MSPVEKRGNAGNKPTRRCLFSRCCLNDITRPTATYAKAWRYWRMDELGRLKMLQAVARKGEQDLARQRQLIEDLRLDGQRTTEAEDVLRRFETIHQALLAKLKSAELPAAAD